VAEEAGPHQIGDWISLGGVLERGAAVASWGDGGECELFAIHDDGELRDRYWDGTRWHDWESLGGAFKGQPAAAARDADRIDVFAFDRESRLAHRWWDGKQWVPWELVDGAPAGDSVSCAWSGTRLDVFVTRDGGALWYKALA
jgi:sialidase-1